MSALTRLRMPLLTAGHLQGHATLSKVFLPVIEATLSKREEAPEVLVPALAALSQLLAAELLPAAAFLLPLRAPLPALRLLLHRSTAVRGAAVALVATLAASLDVADLFALLAPALQHALGLRALPDLNPLLFSERTVVRVRMHAVTAHACVLHGQRRRGRLHHVLLFIERVTQTKAGRQGSTVRKRTTQGRERRCSTCRAAHACGHMHAVTARSAAS